MTRKSTILFSLLLIGLLGAAACRHSGNSDYLMDGPLAPKPANANLNYTARIVTTMGTITAQLFPRQAPLAVGNFVGLATGTQPWFDLKTGRVSHQPLYNGTIFHRVIPGFMIQGGDPLGTGNGTPGYMFPDEQSSLQYDRPGRLGMANAGPNTNGSQFFITVAPRPNLNGHYTIFGQVTAGQQVVDAISKVPRNSHDRPLQPVQILRIEISESPATPTPAATAPAAHKP